MGITHAYYSSCWFSSKVTYSILEKDLRKLLWANMDNIKWFHRTNSKLYCTLSLESLVLSKNHLQDKTLCAKWVIRVVDGNVSWNILLRHWVKKGYFLKNHSKNGYHFKPFYLLYLMLKFLTLLFCEVYARLGRPLNPFYIGIISLFNLVYPLMIKYFGSYHLSNLKEIH